MGRKFNGRQDENHHCEITFQVVKMVCIKSKWNLLIARYKIGEYITDEDYKLFREFGNLAQKSRWCVQHVKKKVHEQNFVHYVFMDLR